jgi:Mg/Co/Ni transporter MgtE
VIPWQDVAYLEEKNPLRLKKSNEKISKLPPADIALILSDLDRAAGQSLMKNMDIEVLADTLEESPTKTQIDVLTHLDSHQAADVLEEMEPDEAADLLADMPRETSHELLQLMEEDEAQEIRTLLHYDPDTVGGIMTTEFAWIYEGLSASQAIDFLRSSEDAQDVDDMYYIYVLDRDAHLKGVIYLRDLVMAKPDEQVEGLMDSKPVTISPHSNQNDAAYLVAKYDLLAIPVVDETTNKMLGIVTLDDALDTVLPTAYKKRLPRFF